MGALLCVSGSKLQSLLPIGPWWHTGPTRCWELSTAGRGRKRELTTINGIVQAQSSSRQANKGYTRSLFVNYLDICGPARKLNPFTGNDPAGRPETLSGGATGSVRLPRGTAPAGRYHPHWSVRCPMSRSLTDGFPGSLRPKTRALVRISATVKHHGRLCVTMTARCGGSS